MKKLLKTVFLLTLLTLIMSCASKAKTEDVQDILVEPEYNEDSGTDMDKNWALYYSTGDEAYLENVIAYADTQDLLIKKVNERYQQLSQDSKFVEAFINMGAEQKDGYFESSYDLELFVFYMLRMDKYKADVQYIYSFFEQDLFVRGVMKSTAFWSLISNAQQYEDINIAIQKHIPYLNKKCQMNFYSFLQLKEYIGFIKSDNGIGIFQNGKLYISIALVNDINQAFDAWVSVPENENPKIRNTTKVDSENNSIAPFLVFYCNDWEDFPIYFDVELMNPDGSVSPEKGKKLSLIEENQNLQNLLYAASQSYCWTFDKGDKNGNYIIRITIHTATRVIAVFDMDFVIDL